MRGRRAETGEVIEIVPPVLEPGDVGKVVTIETVDGVPAYSLTTIPAGGVLSVFGRGGAVVAVPGDYAASQVTNDSTVAGAAVDDALDALKGAIAALVTGVSSVYGRAGAVVATAGDYVASEITNDSTVPGAAVDDALDALKAEILALVTGVSSVYGRAGAVTAQVDDYAASQIANDSATVAGTEVSGALDALKALVDARVTPINKLVVVDPAGTAGNGAFSGNQVFTTLAAAIAASPSGTAIIVTASTGEAPVAWIDKRFSIVGYSLTEPSSHVVQLPLLQPSTSGPTMALTLVGVSAQVNPGNSINVIASNCVVDALGGSGTNYIVLGAPETSQFSNASGGLAVQALIARGTTIAASTINSQFVATASVVAGTLVLGLAATITDTDIGGHALSFPAPETLNIDVQSLKTAGVLTNCTVVLVDAQPLSAGKFIYWDFQTVVPLSHQNGTQEAPYSVLQTAVTACGATGGVLLCAGTGSTAQDFTFDGAGINNTLDIVSLRGNDPREPVSMGVATLQNHCHVTAFGIHFEDIIGSFSRFWGMCCGAGHAQMQAGNFRWNNYQTATPGDTTPKWALGNVDCTVNGTFAAINMKIAGNVQIGGTGATTENCIQQCDLVGGGLGIYIANAGTILYIDKFSLATARRQGFSVQWVNNIGTTVIMDSPLTKSQVFVVPNLAAAFADVTINPFAGVRPNDTFSFAPNPAAILANVAPVAAWCPAANQLTVRFFGTTAGGNYQLDINVNANSGN